MKTSPRMTFRFNYGIQTEETKKKDHQAAERLFFLQAEINPGLQRN